MAKGARNGGTREAAGPWSVEEYLTASGENLVLGFFKGLTGEHKAEAIALLKLVRERGNRLGMPHSEALGKGLFELRGKQGVRIYYTFRPGRRVVLLDGMIKKRGSIPPKVLARIRGLVAEVKGTNAKTTDAPGQSGA